MYWSAICWASLKLLGPRGAPGGRSDVAVAHRAQHARLVARRLGAGVVGEDVVELVAAAALEAADVRPLAVAVLELGLRLELTLALGDGLVARVVLLGQAEVDERAVPCVADCHRQIRVRGRGSIPSPGKTVSITDWTRRSCPISPKPSRSQSNCPQGACLRGERRGRGRADRPAARPHRHAALRDAGLAPARARPAIGWSATTPAATASRIRRRSPRPTSTPTWSATSRRCSTSRGIERAVLAGSSMGAATARGVRARAARAGGRRWCRSRPASTARARAPTSWRLGRAGRRRSRRGDIDALRGASPPATCPSRDGATRSALAVRQRVERHRHPEAVADALRAVPRSAPFDGLDQLERLDVPTLVVGQPRRADPGHPLAVARGVRERLPRAELVVEDEGKSPLAWQGAQLSRAIAVPAPSA